MRRHRHVLGLLPLCAALACSDADTPPLEPGERPTGGGATAGASAIPDSVRRGTGLPPRTDDSTVRALGPRGDTLVIATVGASPAWAVSPSQVSPGSPTGGPMRLEVRVLARDTSTSVYRPLQLGIAACPVVLRLYRTPDRAGTPAWRSDAAGALACPTPWAFGGDLNDRTVTWEVPAVLGDSLPAGRYYFAYDVRLTDGRVLSYATGSAYLTVDPTPPARDFAALRYAAAARVEGEGPRYLTTTVWVHNPTARWLRVAYGGCSVKVRLFRTSARAGTPTWRSELRRPPYPNSQYGCPAALWTTALPPGDSLRFGLAVPLYEILADSLPAGRYYGAAELELLDDALRPTDWRVVTTHDLGAIDLPAGPDRLPAVRVLDGVRIEATTRLLPGAGGIDTVRTLAMLTNTTAAPRVVHVSRDCPLIVYAYRSAALRDSVPSNVEPAWRPRQPCAISPYGFTLAPGQSWVFHHDVLASELRATVGPVRVWLTAWLPSTTGGMLAAGDVELR